MDSDPEQEKLPVVEFKTIPPTDRAEDLLWTVLEVADFLRVKPSTVRAMAKRKELPGVKVGRSWRFKKSAIKRLLPD